MTFTPRPHDLLWLNNANALLTVEEAWVATVAPRFAGGGAARCK
jgi:hypothetical protein